jgi:hypothetical protein
MLFGLSNFLMSNGPPPSVEMGGKEKMIANRNQTDLSPSYVYGANHHLLPAQPTVHTNAEELNNPMESNHMKRCTQIGEEDNTSNKRIKARPVYHSNSNELPGWGPNGRALSVPDSSLLLGSLVPNQILQNNYFNNNASAKSSSASSNSNFFAGNDFAFNQAREQATRNDAVNAMLLAKLYSSNGQHPSIGTNFSILDIAQQQQNHVSLQSQLRHQVSRINSINQINHLLYGNPISGDNSSYQTIMNVHDPREAEQLSSLLRHFQATNSMQQNNQNATVTNPIPIHGATAPISDASVHQATHSQHNSPARQVFPSLPHTNLDLPLCAEGKIKSHVERPFFSLGISEDPNWLSEFHCFVRSDLVEVYRASHDDVTTRNNSISYQQVGIRCRFCAHLPPSSRSGRSSAFPSSLRQIYQSFTMMLRDHFATCEAIPSSMLLQFNTLKDKPAQGATDSKRYWIYSAKKIGMIDTDDGIKIDQQSRYDGLNVPSFGTVIGQKWEDDAFRSNSLVRSTDRHSVSEFLFILMSQVQPIRLTETECIGNRRSLQVGLPGFGCLYCCDQKRLGLGRMFPARRRTLPQKVNDLYDHLRRCTLCPQSVKDNLERSKHQMTTSFRADQGSDREFFDRVWNRLGHSGVSAST